MLRHQELARRGPWPKVFTNQLLRDSMPQHAQFDTNFEFCVTRARTHALVTIPRCASIST